jgi:Holliday junction resolvase
VVNSKEKGKRGEREVAELLRKFGYEARRGQQFSGSPDSPDVVHNIPGLHLEVKFRERFQLYDSMEQAEKDDPEKVPVVFHRRKHKKWVAILYADDLLNLLGGKNEQR